mgnify:CR=1 FL=1
MDYQQRKQMERKRAEDFIASINAMQDPAIMYKVSHPITDLKDMMNQSVARYGRDHVAFKQRFVKGEPFREITYGQTLDDMNALGTAMLVRDLQGKRVAVIGDNCYQWATTYLAVTGGVGVGVFKGFEVIDQMLELNRTEEPDPEAGAAYGPVKEGFEVCYKAMLPVYEYMASHKNA